MTASHWSGKALFAVVVWGASFVATRIACESFTPIGLVASRLVVAAVFLTVIAGREGGPFLPARADLATCLLLGLVLGGHTLIQTIGLKYTSAINASWLVAFTPIPIALGGKLFLKERLSSSGWLGVAVAAGGVVLIVLATTPGFAEARTGDVLQLTSCLTWTVYTLAAMGVIRRNGALRVSSAVTIVAAAVAVPACARAGLLAAPPTSRSILAMLFLGLLCSALGTYFWYAALHEQGATRAGAYLYVEPFVTVVLAAAILGEPITLPVIAGGLLALTGVWLVERSRIVQALSPPQVS